MRRVKPSIRKFLKSVSACIPKKSDFCYRHIVLPVQPLIHHILNSCQKMNCLRNCVTIQWESLFWIIRITKKLKCKMFIHSNDNSEINILIFNAKKSTSAKKKRCLFAKYKESFFLLNSGWNVTWTENHLYVSIKFWAKWHWFNNTHTDQIYIFHLADAFIPDEHFCQQDVSCFV